MREEDEEVPAVSLMEMGPGAPMPISFLNVDDPRNASERSFLETGPGAPIPLSFFLVNSSLQGKNSSEDPEKAAPDTPATENALAGKQHLPVNASTPEAHREDIPRPIQRSAERVTQQIAQARARMPVPTPHTVFLTIMGVGLVVFIVILFTIMRCVCDAVASAYESAVERSRPPMLSSLRTPGPLEKGLETLLRIPQTAREDTVAKKEAVQAETGSTCSYGTLARPPPVQESDHGT